MEIERFILEESRHHRRRRQIQALGAEVPPVAGTGHGANWGLATLQRFSQYKSTHTNAIDFKIQG